MKATHSPQWLDKGTYKEPKDGDNIRVPRLEVDDATTYVDKDGSNNMTLTDAVTGTKTLAQLSAAGSGDVTAAAVIADHAIVRGDGGAKGVQDSAVTIDDSGNISIGAALLKTTNLALKEYNSTYFGARNVADNAFRSFICAALSVQNNLIIGVNGQSIDTRNEDGTYFIIKARDSGEGLVEIARAQGAADPYFQATLPLVLLPIATASLPAAPVEGMVAYDDTLNKFVVFTGAAWIPWVVAADITATKLDAFTAPDDTTTLDASAALHGLMPKADSGKLAGIATGADVTANNAPQAHEASHQAAGGDILYVPRTYVWFVKGTVAVGTEQGATFRMKRATTVEDVELHVKTAPTGAALIVDINDGGTTIFSTKPEIDISGTVEDDNHVISDTALAATTELTMDVDQVGSTIAGADLTVCLHVIEAVA